MQVRVKEGMLGYYGMERRRSGKVFTIKSEKDFCESWMERVDGSGNPAVGKSKASEGKRVGSKEQTAKGTAISAEAKRIKETPKAAAGHVSQSAEEKAEAENV